MTAFLAALFALACLGWGTLVGNVVAHLDRAPRRPSAYDLVSAWGLGLWCASVLALGLGAFGALRPLPVLIAVFFGAGLGGHRLYAHPPRLSLRGVEWLVFAAIAVHLGLNLLRSLAPDTSWDALAYHLADARLFAERGGFVDLPSIRQARWPQGLDAMFALAESLGGGALSGATAWMVGATGCLGVAALGGQLGGRRGALAAAGLFVASPVVALFSGVAYVDVGLAGLAALAVAAALAFAREGRVCDLAVAGLLAGAAGATKYTGLLQIPITAWVLVMTVTARRARAVIVATTIAVLAASPWYLRTHQLTGNPIWPYAYEWLGGREWSVEHARDLARFERGYGPGHGAVDLIASPFRAFFEPRLFDGHRLGLGLLLLAPLAFVAWDRRRGVVAVALAGSWVAWFLTTQQIRFLVPALPYAVALVGGGIAAVRSPRRAGLALVAVAAVGAPTLMASAQAVRERLAVLTGAESVEHFESRHVDCLGAIQFVNRVLRPKRLLLFRELRGYPLDVPYLWGDPLNQALIDYHRLATVEDLYHRLQELGVDAVLVNDNLYPPTPGYYEPELVARMERLLAGYGRLVYFQGGLRVYVLP